jgi:peptidoglycan/LPS O-acetylase OafA/YrhL
MEKLNFAHQLRGLAALVVVFTHLFGTFFGAQPFISTVSFSKDLNIVKPDWVHYFEFGYFNGPFGVAIFFLISGFVIPFSLSSNSPARFLIARFFRIVPTYALAFCLSMLVLAYSAHVWGEHFSHSFKLMALNGLLIHSFVGAPTIDPISWTLSIELKFYLLMAVLGSVFLQKKFSYFALFLALALLLTKCMPYAQVHFPPAIWMLMYNVGFDLNYVLFMLIGVVFHQHFRQTISAVQLVLRTSFIGAIFAANWSIGPQAYQFPIITGFYFYALLGFTLCYACRNLFRPIWILDFLGDISFPIYITHSLIGFALLKLLMREGLTFGPAISIVSCTILLLSWLIHKFVEMPSNSFGKKLARLGAAP